MGPCCFVTRCVSAHHDAVRVMCAGGIESHLRPGAVLTRLIVDPRCTWSVAERDVSAWATCLACRREDVVWPPTGHRCPLNSLPANFGTMQNLLGGATGGGGPFVAGVSSVVGVSLQGLDRPRIPYPTKTVPDGKRGRRSMSLCCFNRGRTAGVPARLGQAKGS